MIGLVTIVACAGGLFASTATAEAPLNLLPPALGRTWVARAESRPRMLVLEMHATLGVDPELARLLGDMVTSRLHAIGRHEVVSSADVAAMVGIETQKQLLGCTDDACLTEIGGALNANLLVVGSVSQLADRDVITLKLLDTSDNRLVNQLTEELPAEQREYEDAMRVVAYNLLSMEVPELPAAWYENAWLWVAVSAAVVGGTVAGVLLTRPPTVPDAGLGRVVLDAQ